MVDGERKEEGEPSRERGRTHAFLELKLPGGVILQSQGDSFLGLSAISNDPPTNRPNSGRQPSPSFLRPGQASGPGWGGSAAQDPHWGSGALRSGLPRGADLDSASQALYSRRLPPKPQTPRQERLGQTPRVGSQGRPCWAEGRQQSQRGLQLPPRLRPRWPR